MLRKGNGLLAMALAVVFALVFIPQAAHAKTLSRPKVKPKASAGRDPSVYHWNDENGDAEFFFINPTSLPLCANVYIFDDSEELQECCSEFISPNGFCETELEDSLITNPANGVSLFGREGVIELVASPFPFTFICDAGSAYTAFGTIAAWATSAEDSGAGVATTQEEFTEVPVDDANIAFMQTLCFFIEFNGSGIGQCELCTS